MRLGPNDPCRCGSGLKFKKCCLPHGGLTPIERAEVEAYREKRERERPAGAGTAAMLPMLLAFGAMQAPMEALAGRPKFPISRRHCKKKG